jgi:hypothetical protein
MMSRNIFHLIDEVCQGEPAVINGFDEAAFKKFAEAYLELASHREAVLRKHLASRDCYRTFMPVCSFTFNSINDVIWYYNEVLLCDPVLFMLNDPTMPDRGKQGQVAEAVQALLNLRHQIESGYVLLTNVGSGIDFESFAEEAKHVIELPSIFTGFEKEFVIRKQPSVLPDGRNLGMFQLIGEYHGWTFSRQPTSLYIPDDVKAEALKDGVNYSFTGTFTRVGKAELRRMGKDNMITNNRGWFNVDAQRVISALHCSTELDMPVQYFRHIDFSIAETYSIGFSDPYLQTKIDKQEVFRTILPFVKGIDPARLMQIREELPQVFTQFRGLFFSLVQEAREKNMEELSAQEWIRTKVSSEKKYLEKEMRNLLRKSKYNPASAQQDYRKGSLVQPLSPLYKSSDRPTLKKYPMYFLWKAAGDLGT